MHKTSGLRDPAAAFPLPHTRDDRQDRRHANRAMGVRVLGLAATGLAELFLGISTEHAGIYCRAKVILADHRVWLGAFSAANARLGNECSRSG